MTLLRIGEVFQYVIGGGWGEDSVAPGLAPVTIIRGADFPQAQVQDARNFPRRFEDPSAVTRRSLKAGDLVLEISGGTKERPTGRTIFITEAILDSIDGDLIPASFCRLVRPDQKRVDPRWLYYFMQNWWNRGESWNFQNQSTGISNFRFKVFSEEVTLQLPDRAQQEAASAALGALDDKIAANRSFSRLADELLRTRFLQLATSDTRLEHIAQPARATVGAKDIKPDTTYIGLEHLDRRSMWLQRSGLGAQATSAKTRFQLGDTLFGKLRPYFHKVSVSPTSGVCSTDIIVLRPVVQTHWMLIAAAASTDSSIAAAVQASNGTKMPRAKWEDIARLPVPDPSTPEAMEFCHNASSVAQRTFQAERENLRLAATRDELLPLLMSGRITVKDAEKTVEDVI